MGGLSIARLRHGCGSERKVRVSRDGNCLRANDLHRHLAYSADITACQVYMLKRQQLRLSRAVTSHDQALGTHKHAIAHRDCHFVQGAWDTGVLTTLHLGTTGCWVGSTCIFPISAGESIQIGGAIHFLKSLCLVAHHIAETSTRPFLLGRPPTVPQFSSGPNRGVGFQANEPIPLAEVYSIIFLEVTGQIIKKLSDGAALRCTIFEGLVVDHAFRYLETLGALPWMGQDRR